jgi:leader peptidase (prepilin peptidase)/N-methyltransferase
MGMGDVKLLAMLGGFLGWQGVLTALVVGSLIGSLIGLTVMMLKGKSLRLAIPFGPFLALGALVHLFWGTELVAWYLDPLLG